MKAGTESVSIIGLGYVGLCTAATFASRGISTIGIDIDEERIRQIQRGRAPVHEPGLDLMLRNGVRKKLLKVDGNVSSMANSNVTFITVGTPSQIDGSIDLTFVKNATEQLAMAIREKDDYHLVVVKSTVIPGTTNRVVRPILEEYSRKKSGADVGLCANPEFLKEGTAIDDALHPDKIIIGANDKKSTNQLTRLYRKFHHGKLPPILITSPEEAELVKYASNAFLATKVSYINTIANIAQYTPGVDVNRVAEAIGYDPRIGSLFLKAGPGYGGSCFHKDLQALINYSQNNNYDPVLFRATEETNERQADKVVELSERLAGPLENKRIAVLGLAFKKDTDDIREAASLKIIDRLRSKGSRIVAFDPMAIPNAKKIVGDTIEFAPDPQTALKGADCCIVTTEWNQFKKLKAGDFIAQMRNPILVDARRIYQPEKFRELKFAAVGLG